MGTSSSVRSRPRKDVRYKNYQRARRQRRQRIVAAVVLIALVVVAVLLIVNRADSTDNVQAFELVHGPYSDIPISGRTLGDASAPVTVVEYGDYQCPGCGHFAREIESKLVQDYVATGKVRFEFRDYAFIGEESTSAAQAAACAQDQQAFWDYHATLFHSQLGENEGGFGAKRLEAMARGLGLDKDQFASCLDDGLHAGEVEDMRAEATAYGIAGTPSFVVNGTLIEYRGYDSLRAAIDAALEETQS